MARELQEQRGKLRRDVYLIAFSGEEEGTLGSTFFTRHPTAGLKTGDLLKVGEATFRVSGEPLEIRPNATLSH